MLRPFLLLLTSSLALSACKDKGDEPEVLDVTWDEFETVYGLANFDDDNENGTMDWEDASAAGENDLAPLTIPSSIFEDLVDEGSLSLTLFGDEIRIWNGEALLLEDGGEATLESDGDLVLGVEFAAFLSRGTLTLTARDDAGDLLHTSDIAVMSGPMILNNHSMYAEEVMAMSYTGFGGNTAFINGFDDIIDDIFEPVPVSNYGYDVWVQDEIEFATLTAPGHRIDIVIDSIRTGNGSGLDEFPEQEYEGPDFASHTWGDGGPSSQDSFGNMEVTPPFTHNDVAYPFGRIYWGEYFGYGPRDEVLLETLNDQLVQAPFQLDISWLCVGHVDEFMTFLPDPDSTFGHKLLYTDVDLGYTYLEELDGDLSLPRYESDHGYATVAEIIEDEELRELNEDIRDDYLIPNLEIMKEITGITDEDIILIPMLFEEVAFCGGSTATLIPSTVNMTVVQREGEDTVHAFMPDPFLRDSTSYTTIDEDPFAAYVEELLPENVEAHWLDDWEWYHIMLGEVHCGSNTIRTPNANWWEVATHLLEETR